MIVARIVAVHSASRPHEDRLDALDCDVRGVIGVMVRYVGEDALGYSGRLVGRFIASASAVVPTTMMPPGPNT